MHLLRGRSLLIFLGATLALGALPAAAGASPLSKHTTPQLAYDLVSANGTVTSFGGAGNFGGTQDISLRAPIVGMAVAPDGGGYWLAARNGSIYNRGDAKFYGSLGNQPLPPPAHYVVGIVATNNGKGYWLCDASGRISAFGDARKLPSLPAGRTTSPVVGCEVIPSERGAIEVTAAGNVFNLGAARWHGSLARKKLAHPIVAVARTTSGAGYWLLDSAGDVFAFGDARAPAADSALAAPAAGIAAAPDGLGFWAVAASGTVVASGVPSEGELADLSGGEAVVGMATAPPVPLPKAGLAYDLVSQNGTVTSFGGAGNFGGTENVSLRSLVVGMAVTPDGRGYWVFTENGSVYNLGDAKFYGSPGSGPLPAPAHYIIGLVPTRDGQGYWLIDASGEVRNYGDAPALSSLPAADATSPIVGYAVTPDQEGAWLVNGAGDVFTLGRAASYGSLAGKSLSHPIVAMAATPDGGGYWLADSAGDVFAFGDAADPAPPPALSSPVVSIAAAPDDLGYWAVAAGGTVISSGVPSEGDLQNLTGSEQVVGMAAALPISTTEQSPYPSGSVGYDVNWPQCAKTGSSDTGQMPGPPDDPNGTASFSVAIIGVDGWAADDYNSCLAAEVAWAEGARVAGSSVPPPYQLYLFLNSPSSSSTIDASGPAGTCADLAAGARPACLAYNYGYNSALDAVGYGTSQGATAQMWWLDIENDSCSSSQWNDESAGEWWSCDQALNDQTIQGAIDGLRHDGRTAGVYSTSLQWNNITGHFVPAGAQLPLWIAGAPWTSPPYPASDHYEGTSALLAWCSGDYDFAGGVPSILQETPGSNNYPFDPDYAC